MDYTEFRRNHPASRHFQLLTSEQRANQQASRRLGRRQREATHERFYTHPFCEGIAFPSASAATTEAYRRWLPAAVGAVCCWLEDPPKTRTPTEAAPPAP
jgi:hypothetical protein